MTATLLHLTSPRAWRDALQTGSLRTASLQGQGFVHLSAIEQIAIPANAVFAGVPDALLLCVDPARVPDEIRYERGRPEDPRGREFPHLYGPLPTAAVIATVPYRAGAEGRFGTPTAIPDIDDVAARAAAFVLSHLRRRAHTEIPVEGGFVVRDPRFPDSYEHNALVLTAPVPVPDRVDVPRIVLGDPDTGRRWHGTAGRSRNWSGWRCGGPRIAHPPRPGGPSRWSRSSSATSGGGPGRR